VGVLHLARRSPVALLTWPLRHIRWKIILPYAFLTLVLAGVGSYLATNIVTGSLEERFDNQLAEAGRVTSDAVVRTERAHLEVVRSVAFTQGVPNAAAEGNTDVLSNLVEPIAVNSGIERLEVLDASGNRLIALALDDPDTLEYRTLTDDDEPGSWFATQAVLQGEVDDQGDKHAQIIETSEGFVLFTAGPINLPSGTVGVVLAGTTLETFLLDTGFEALASITIYDFDGQPLASGFADQSTGEANLTVTDPSIFEAVTAGETIRETRIIWGREYDVVYSTLKLRGTGIGVYSVALPTDFIFSAGNETRTQVAVLFGLGIMAVLGIGLLLANRITQPILRLVRTATRVTAGDLSARSGVRTSDEIGTLAASFDEMTSRLQRQHLNTIRALTSAIDARDPYTKGHSVRVGQLSVLLGEQMQLGRSMLSHLETGGYLHDIGKIGIRDHILLKPGKLTDEERKVIQDHPRIGLEILQSVELPAEVVDFVAAHHEWLDGTGYPNKLRGDEISMVARIAAVSDVYDALTTDRPYRIATSPEETMAILNSEAGTHLDPDVIRSLRNVLNEWEWRRKTEPQLRGFVLEDAGIPEPVSS